MSWLFGVNKNQDVPQMPILPEGMQVPGQPGNNPPPPNQPTKSKMDAYTFDSAALERAAKAAKELETSSLLYNNVWYIYISYIN